jgi:hypothetical protein
MAGIRETCDLVNPQPGKDKGDGLGALWLAPSAPASCAAAPVAALAGVARVGVAVIAFTWGSVPQMTSGLCMF